MPYFLHLHNTLPETGTPYPDKQSAIAARTNGLTISYLSNETDRETWTQRERRRLLDHIYTALPWLDDDGIPQRRYRTLANDSRGYGDETPFSNYIGSSQIDRYVDISRYHFAHVSLKSDAMIAYTPSDEHGHADRQIRIRCGKYLDLVAPWLLPIEKDKLCARVRSMASAMFKLATTPAEIRAVYRYGSGFSSCMDGRNFSADDDTNPVSAYGDSDLAVAYLGDIESDDARVTARVVVWPEKKLYTRIYGDELLACLLKQDAWQSPDWENGFPLTGAKLRAIPVRGSTRRYVMPYLDFANTVSLSSDKQHFIVCGPDDPGEFGCRETNGRSGSREIECDHCGGSFTQSEDGESECESCRENMWTCDECSDMFYDDDDCEQVQSYISYRRYAYCERCVNRLAHTCDRCDEHFYDCQFSPAEHTTRRNGDLPDYCRSCVDDVIEERTKEEDDTDTPNDVVSVVATDDMETLPLPLAPTPNISTDLKVYDCGHTSEVGVIVQIASLYPQGTTVYLTGDNNSAYFNCYPAPDLHATVHQTAFQVGERYQVVQRDGRYYAWLRRLPIPDDRPWRDIPIGATVQVITIPHHTGVKEGSSLRWHLCGAPDSPLCSCQNSPVNENCRSYNIPEDMVYRVLEMAGQA